MSCGITGHSPPPHPAVSRSMAGWRKAIGGSARRSRGVRIQANAQTPIRLYRAVKTQGRRRKKGEDRPSGASSADPDGDRGDEPNSPITAGASEFVLLAAEKNEQAQTSFFNPSVTTCHLPYILLRKTQRRRLIVNYPLQKPDKFNLTGSVSPHS